MRSYSFVSGEYREETEVRRSKFIAAAFGEAGEEEAEAFVRKIRAEFPDATHTCWAYVAGENAGGFRASDDGEPSGTAGAPIGAVIKKRGLTNTVVTVTRYFGGVKLGANGLIGAYADAASQVLEKAVKATKTYCARYEFQADYSDYSAIAQSAVRRKFVLSDAVYSEKVTAVVTVPEECADAALAEIEALTGGRVSPVLKEKLFVKA